MTIPAQPAPKSPSRHGIAPSQGIQPAPGEVAAAFGSVIDRKRITGFVLGDLNSP